MLFFRLKMVSMHAGKNIYIYIFTYILYPPNLGNMAKINISINLIAYSCRYLILLYKLDGVGLIDNRPSTDKLQHFVNKPKNERKKIYILHVTCYMWHVTCNMRHVTCETWHVVGGEHAYTHLLSDRGDTCSTLATWLYKQQDLEEKDQWVSYLMTQRQRCL